MHKEEATSELLTPSNGKNHHACLVWIDTIDDVVEVLGREVLCVDVMRDRDRGFVSALVLIPLKTQDRDNPVASARSSDSTVYRRVRFSTLTKISSRRKKKYCSLGSFISLA
jgi:hypothetical protein